MSKQKEEILAGVQNVLIGNGFTNTNMDSVLREANISKGVFYNYFKTKNDILLAILDFESHKLFAKMDELFEGHINPLASLNSFFDWKVNENASNGFILARFGTEFIEKEIYLKKRIKKIYGEYVSYIVKILEEAVDNGQLVSSTPVKKLANFIVYSIEGGNFSVNMTNSKEQFVDVVTMVKRIVRSYRKLDVEVLQ